MSCKLCTQRAAPFSNLSATHAKPVVGCSPRITKPFSQPKLSQRSCRRPVRLQAEVSEAQPAEVEASEVQPSEAQASQEESTPEHKAQFALNVLWLDKSIGLAVDQVFKNDQRTPITEYFFWPKADAWEQLNVCMEGKDWISERSRVLMLNATTDIINYWQDEEEPKGTLEGAREKFPDVVFQGA